MESICPHCERPRCTAADLERWFREFPQPQPQPDPAWARAICWTKAGYRCGCKPSLRRIQVNRDNVEHSDLGGEG